jgi:hypothetical protein
MNFTEEALPNLPFYILECSERTFFGGVRTNKLEFQPEFLGRVQLVVAVATLAGVAVYNSFLKHVILKKMFLWTTILGTLLGLTQVSSVFKTSWVVRFCKRLDLFVKGYLCTTNTGLSCSSYCLLQA